MTELSPVFDRLRDWKLRVYRAIWARIRQAWTGERWIRVTDQKETKFLGVNQYEMNPMGQINSQNVLAEVDVDIILDEGPDSITMQEEEFEQLTKMAQAGIPIPPQTVIKASSLRNKQELLEGLLERMALDMTRLIDVRMTQLLAADVRTAVKMLLGEMLAFIRGGDGRYLEVVRHWQQLQTLQVVDRLEQHLSEVCRRYLLRHVREYPIENPIPVLFVIINGTLMTLVRYLALENPPLSEEELIDSLTEMLAAYLASAAQHRASPPLARAPD